MEIISCCSCRVRAKGTFLFQYHQPFMKYSLNRPGLHSAPLMPLQTCRFLCNLRSWHVIIPFTIGAYEKLYLPMSVISLSWLGCISVVMTTLFLDWLVGFTFHSGYSERTFFCLFLPNGFPAVPFSWGMVWKLFTGKAIRGCTEEPERVDGVADFRQGFQNDGWGLRE